MYHLDYATAKSPKNKRKSQKIIKIGGFNFGMSILYGGLSQLFDGTIIESILIICFFISLLSFFPLLELGIFIKFKEDPGYRAQKIKHVLYNAISNLAMTAFMLFNLIFITFIAIIVNSNLTYFLFFVFFYFFAVFFIFTILFFHCFRKYNKIDE